MIIDKKGKVFGKISIVDILVLLLIIAAAFGIFVRMSGDHGLVRGESSKINFVVEIKGIRQPTVDAFMKGDRYFDTAQSYYGKKVGQIEVKDATESMQMTNGDIILAKVPDRYDIRLTLELDVKETKDGFYNEKSDEIGAGKFVPLSSKHVNNAVAQIIQVNKHK